MKNAIIYLKGNPLSNEMISCGFVYILEDGSSLFKWSRKKLSLFNRTLTDSKEIKSSLRSLIRMNLNCLERYALKGEKQMENYLNHMRIHGTGLLTVGEFHTFVPIKEDINEDFNFWFKRTIENEV